MNKFLLFETWHDHWKMKLPLLKTFYCKTFKSTTAFILFDKKTFYKKLGTKQRSISDPAEAAVQRKCRKFTGEHPCCSVISIKLLLKSHFGMGVLQ